MTRIIDFPTKTARKGMRAAKGAKAAAGPAKILLFTGIRYTRVEDVPETDLIKRQPSAWAGTAVPIA